MKNSLRSQLWLWMLPVVAIWIVSTVFVYIFAGNLARSTYDEELAEVAKSISVGFKTREGLFALDLPPAALDILTYDLRDKFYYQVVGPKGHLVAGDNNFPPAPTIEAINRAVFTDGMLDGRAVRIATIRLPVDAGRFALVRVAETLTAREQLTNRMLLTVLIPGVICIALLGISLYVAIGRSLAPLEVIRKNVDRRSYLDLNPLSESNVPVEVAPLVRAINLLLARLQTDIESHRRFVANAAHQLRTPLAGIQTQTELALAEQDAATREQILRKIEIGAERGSRLVHQLLTLARVDESLKDTHRPTDAVELEALTSSCIEEMSDDARANKVELVFKQSSDQQSEHRPDQQSAQQSDQQPDQQPDQQSDPLIVSGNALMLREMLLNIIDNAIRYTPAGTRVTIGLQRAGDQALISVTDTGKGIPADDQPRLFERFYRVMGSPPGGSGLGLAIVQEIAVAHHGKVSLHSSTSEGTRVTVTMPLTAQDPPNGSYL